MTKYHISEDGNPRPCRASKNPCRFGDEDSHYKDAHEARRAYEQKQVVEAFKAKDPEAASVEAFSFMVGPRRVGSGIDLPPTEHSRQYRSDFDRHILVGNMASAQKALKAWMGEIEHTELSSGWKQVLELRGVYAKSVIDADPAKLDAYIDERYFRPHAVNPRDPEDVRGGLAAKADGWSVQDGHKMVHANGMTLTMTPGHADTSGWSISGPEGWRAKYFQQNSGLYPVNSLLEAKTLNRVASYGA